MDEGQQKSIEFGNWLFSGHCQFIAGAKRIEDLLDETVNEVAFAGLSNVGKSSLINALTGRKTLVRTSNTPGQTNQLNFFSLRDKLILVDLPGYGYAKVSKKDRNEWKGLIRDYLMSRTTLKKLCLLIDSRRGLKESDRDIMYLLDDIALSYQLVLTKADKTKKTDVDKIISDIKSVAINHTALLPEVFVTSSREKEGIESLRADLARLI